MFFNFFFTTAFDEMSSRGAWLGLSNPSNQTCKDLASCSKILFWEGAPEPFGTRIEGAAHFGSNVGDRVWHCWMLRGQEILGAYCDQELAVVCHVRCGEKTTRQIKKKLETGTWRMWED